MSVNSPLIRLRAILVWIDLSVYCQRNRLQTLVLEVHKVQTHQLASGKK